MDKETLFRAIQRREVVLWAGAGFSKYAGFPLGAGIVRHLFDTLSSGQQQQAREYYPAHDKDGYPVVSLPAFASLYVTFHNGQLQPLRREIIKLFSKRPETLKTHEELATIAFIEHIITTNYDSLFEQAYGTDKVHVITEGTHLAYQDNSKVNLYKVHGSLERPDSLFITEDEYRTFYAKADQRLWNYIEGLMLTRTMLFVGYGLEDPNVMALFEQVLASIGSNMRGAYLVAPNLNLLRVEWLRRHNVTYIDCTGEKLVEELLQYLKDTSVPALKQGKSELAPTTKFLRNLGLHATVETLKDGYDITSLTPANKGALHNVKFQVTLDGYQALESLKTGAAGFAVKLDTTKLLSFELRLDGVNLGIDVTTLWAVRRANVQKTVDVEFATGFHLPDVALNIYGGTELIRIFVYSSHLKLEISILSKHIGNKGLRYSGSFERRHKYIDSVEMGLQQAQIMKLLGSGEPIAVYENGEVIWSSEKTAGITKFLAEGEALENTMLGLKTIEKAFGIRFRRFTLSRMDKAVIRSLSRILQMKTHTDAWPGKTEVFRHPDFDGDMVKYIELQHQENNSLVSTREYDDVFHVAGWELQLRYKAAQVIHHPILKKVKGKFFLSSADKKIETYYDAEQTATVVKKGESFPVATPPRVDMPEELNELTKQPPKNNL